NTANYELTTSAGSAPREFPATAAFLFVSEGAAPNFDSHTTYHVTFDASGADGNGSSDREQLPGLSIGRWMGGNRHGWSRWSRHSAVPLSNWRRRWLRMRVSPKRSFKRRFCARS